MTEFSLLPDADLAARYAPQLMLDAHEPYKPHAFGYTIFRTAGQSPSSKFAIEPAGALTVEYAIYYDWDIGHLYDLEHVWVHIDTDGQIIKVEASSHGGRKPMQTDEGLPALVASAHELTAPAPPSPLWGGTEGGGIAGNHPTHPVIYAEAGKHAHWASPDHMTEADRQKLAFLCSTLAGIEGVHLGNPFAKRGDYKPTPEDHRLARLKMQSDAFTPSHVYHPLDTTPLLLPWPELEALIPFRITAAMAALKNTQPHFAAIFLDCGDTLIDERTEQKLPGSEVVVKADLIPGAKEMMDALKAAGHKLILVADGPRQTFVNMLTHHGLWEHFDAHIISEDVGVHKPDPAMFDAALKAAGLTRADASRTVMVGNNLSRDICGANALGITSIFMAWSTLRTHEPANPSEVADYRINSPAELPALLDRLEALIQFRVPSLSTATVC
ncbi:HAD family hydrolase [Devosia sp. Root685]|uniref:HAD family hydrolase n=1 Tax=Devosia sp. Root685 TaxID=1736587 RepID=UPI000AFA5B54|nr:HAD family hydrolase [Devosia sp. Root685]